MMNLYQSPVVFDVTGHTYAFDGKPLIGVTSLMRKHCLSPDYSGVPKGLLDAAAERGSHYHGLVQDYVNGMEMPGNKSEEDFFDGLREFLDANGLSPEVSEYLVSDERTVASKIDLVMGDYAIADFKTTSKVHRSALSWQLSIYACLFEASNKVRVPRLLCLHYDHDAGRFAMHGIDRIPDSEIWRLLECEAEGSLFVPEEDERSKAITEIVRSEDLPRLMGRVRAAKRLADELQARVDAVCGSLYEGMLVSNIDKVEVEGCTLTLRRPHMRATLDTKSLKADLPDVARKYSKTTEVKGSVTISLKDN